MNQFSYVFLFQLYLVIILMILFTSAFLRATEEVSVMILNSKERFQIFFVLNSLLNVL